MFFDKGFPRDDHHGSRGQAEHPGQASNPAWPDCHVRQEATGTDICITPKGEDRFTYSAPAFLLFHHGPITGPTDCHIAATYAMLAAESLGLGSCMLGAVEALNHAKPFKRKYGIPPKNKIGLGRVLGYSDETFRRGIRRRLASVTFA